MIFTEVYGIEDTNNFGFFDAILVRDTKLFIDPFLIFRSQNVYFKDSHNKLITFFNKVFELASKSGENKESLSYKKLLNMLLFPEVQEICLGYSDNSINGSGSGEGFRENILDGIFESIRAGINEYKHFEEIGIFGEGIGCDRISDITANILKSNIIKFTQDICSEYKIPVKETTMRHIDFDFNYLRWIDGKAKLPVNPYNGKSVLLIPEEFLRELPVICAEGFWDYLWDNRNEELRNDFNYELKNEIKKSEIIAIAKKNPLWVNEFVNYAESHRYEAYDLERDKSGVFKWTSNTTNYTNNNPLELKCTGREDFIKVIDSMVNQFKLFVVDNSGYKLLWDDSKTKGKKEEACQLLLYGIVKNYCVANNIDITRESNVGRGPVDFKFSYGYNDRALLEVKLARNSKFWDGIEKQLPQYLKSEQITYGYFMVIAYNEKELKKANDVEKVIGSVCKETGYMIKIIIIDATPFKESASHM
jgi:hypothetical protein